MSYKPTNLTPNQTEAATWGEIYAWIHRRAEMLRQQKAAAPTSATTTNEPTNTHPQRQTEARL